MSERLDRLEAALKGALGERLQALTCDRGELTATVRAADLLDVARTLRDAEALKFEQLMDLAGVDYSAYKDQPTRPTRTSRGRGLASAPSRTC